MKWIFKLWMIIFVIIFIWIYFLFISPKIFNKSVHIVPNIIDMTENDALKKLQDENIKYNLYYQENKSNVVLRTIPYPNTEIKKNYQVDVYIGKVMPVSYKSYLGRIWNEVKEEIEVMCNNNGIKLRVIYEVNNSVLDGVIINETLNNKQTLEGIEELTITISNNNTKLKMPNFVGKHINEVLEFVDRNNLSVIFIYLEVMMAEDIVLYQSINENTIIDKNSIYKIEIYVSKLIT